MPPVTGLSPGDVVEKSYKNTAKATDAERAAFVLRSLGPRVAASAVGLADARQLRAWAAATSQPRGDAEDRLRILYRVAYIVAGVFTDKVAAAFVCGANPELDDESVISVLSGALDVGTEKRLVAAARDFVQG